MLERPGSHMLGAPRVLLNRSDEIRFAVSAHSSEFLAGKMHRECTVSKGLAHLMLGSNPFIGKRRTRRMRIEQLT
jgi:hypothetical protein